MKKCKIYNVANKIEVEATIVDSKVIFTTNLTWPKTYENLVPFSTICGWDEFMEYSYNWANYDQNWWDADEYTLGKLNVTNERWGYFNIVTGEIVIPPQWDWCDDFYEDGFAIVKARGYYGVIDDTNHVEIYPDYYSICNIAIKRAEKIDGVFFVQNLMSEKWCAMDLRWTSFTQEIPNVKYNWDDIWWDGWGGYTVMEKTEDGKELYGIVNDGNKIITQNLTEKPNRYNPPECEARKNSYRYKGEAVSFRIIKNDGKYGLISDPYYNTEVSEMVLEPIYDYEHVIKAAVKESMEFEVSHYAWLIRDVPIYITDVWNNVPQDIQDDIRNYMKVKEWEQPEEWDIWFDEVNQYLRFIEAFPGSAKSILDSIPEDWRECVSFNAERKGLYK